MCAIAILLPAGQRNLPCISFCLRIPSPHLSKPVKNDPGGVKELVELTIYRNTNSSNISTIYSIEKYPLPVDIPVFPLKHYPTPITHLKAYHIRNDLETTCKTPKIGVFTPKNAGFDPFFARFDIRTCKIAISGAFAWRGKLPQKLTCGKLTCRIMPKVCFPYI